MPLNTVSDLPNLLVGPILRRLTRDSVSIFVATRTADAIGLEVWDATNPSDNVTVTATSPTQIGSNLYVIILTAEATGLTGNAYEDGTTYCYKLTGQHFNALDWSVYAYGSHAHPTFVGIPQNPEAFRLSHVSCRKPHGGSRDGMAILDAILREDLDARPHLLMLTGDQIYADDVADCLMPRTQWISTNLVNISEPDLDTELNTSAALRDRNHRAWGFTVDDTVHNQLWTLGEYYAMYLLVWSDVFFSYDGGDWQADDIPSFDATQYAPLSSEEEATYREEYDSQIADVTSFVMDLPRVRKALANVPTLMIFDDHEVTDDWNLNHQWVTDVYSSDSLKHGRRIAANGLLAYNVFQHYGNVPQRFTNAALPEKSILDTLTYDNSTHPFEASSPTVDAVLQTLGLPTDTTGNPQSNPFYALRPNMGTPQDGGVRYDFSITDAYPIRLFVVDNRTTRAYRHDDSVGAIIDNRALDAMLPPSPTNDTRPTVIAFPVPIWNLNVLEHIAQPLLGLSKAKEKQYDLDTNWGIYATAYDNLISRIAAYTPAVILTGDIHMGFTKRVTFNENGTQGIIAEFTSSAAKNANAQTAIVHMLGETATQLGLVRSRTFERYDYDAFFLNDNLNLNVIPQGTEDEDTPRLQIPFDDFIEMASGILHRELLDMQPNDVIYISREIANVYDLPDPAIGATVTVQHITPIPQNGELHPTMTGVSNTTGSDWQQSANMVLALHEANKMRLGQVVQGYGLIAALRFDGTANNYTANQTMYYHHGSDATLAPRLGGSDQNVTSVVTRVQLF